MKYALIGIGVILFIIILSLGLDYGLGVKWYGFIAPQKENVKREVFENTNSYVRGKNQTLMKYYHEYLNAENDSNKEAIAEIIRMEFADFPDENVQSAKLRVFLMQIKY
jgi:hypothetical protein